MSLQPWEIQYNANTTVTLQLLYSQSSNYSCARIKLSLRELRSLSQFGSLDIYISQRYDFG